MYWRISNAESMLSTCYSWWLSPSTTDLQRGLMEKLTPKFTNMLINRNTNTFQLDNLHLGLFCLFLLSWICGWGDDHRCLPKSRNYLNSLSAYYSERNPFKKNLTWLSTVISSSKFLCAEPSWLWLVHKV